MLHTVCIAYYATYVEIHLEGNIENINNEKAKINPIQYIHKTDIFVTSFILSLKQFQIVAHFIAHSNSIKNISFQETLKMMFSG